MIIVMLLFSNFFVQVYTTSVAAKNPITFPIFPRLNPIGNIAILLKPIYNFAEGFKAEPSNITLGVNEKVTIQVGSYNLTTGEFEIPDYHFFMTQRYITFSAEFPGGNPNNVWFVTFNPPMVKQTISQQDLPLCTNVTIFFSSPPKSSDFIQTTLIRIKVIDYWVMGNLWLPDKTRWPGGDNYSFLKMGPFVWFLGAFFGRFGTWSGKTNQDVYYIDVLVNIKPYHRVKIQPLPPSKLAPNEITSIPVLVENQGNYNDTFNLKIRTETGYPLVVTNNGTITLQPGEQGIALVGVAVPANILDTGTLHSIFVEAYSVEQSNVSIASQRIFIETQGLYISEENSVYTIAVGILFLIGLILFIKWRPKREGKTRKKPEKPWKIPEEKQHLDKLRRTDKNVYEQERLMMEDEYKSASLWYKNNWKQKRIEHMKQKNKKAELSLIGKLNTSIKTIMKPKKIQKQKPRKKSSDSLKKSNVTTVKPHISSEDFTKEKILTKIKREQEKQLRKLH